MDVGVLVVAVVFTGCVPVIVLVEPFIDLVVTIVIYVVADLLGVRVDIGVFVVAVTFTGADAVVIPVYVEAPIDDHGDLLGGHVVEERLDVGVDAVELGARRGSITGLNGEEHHRYRLSRRDFDIVDRIEFAAQNGLMTRCDLSVGSPEEVSERGSPCSIAIVVRPVPHVRGRDAEVARRTAPDPHVAEAAEGAPVAHLRGHDLVTRVRDVVHVASEITARFLVHVDRPVHLIVAEADPPHPHETSIDLAGDTGDVLNAGDVQEEGAFVGA